MKAVVCDKCKKVITDKSAVESIIRLELCTNEIGKFDEKHICDDCREKFYDWFKSK